MRHIRRGPPAQFPDGRCRIWNAKKFADPVCNDTLNVTFALGTALGDLTAITLNLGYLGSVVLFAALFCVPALAWRLFGLNPIVAFWAAYVITRPLGASIGDYLSQPTGDGGLDLGTVITSALFLAVVLGLVVHLAVTRKDVAPPQGTARHAA